MSSVRSSPVIPLDPEHLCRTVSSDDIPYKRSDRVSHVSEDLLHPVGQTRAIEAVQFAISMAGQGYNLFCIGQEGVGKASLIRRFVGSAAAAKAPACDWCYVYNFEDSYCPRALAVPAGRARSLAKAMDRLIEDLRHVLPKALETEDHRARKRAVEEEFRQRREDALDEHRKTAEGQGIALIRTPMGLTFSPEREGKILGPEDFGKLPDHEQSSLKEAINHLQTALEKTIRRMPQWERERAEQNRALDRELTEALLDREMADFRQAFDDCAGVLSYLDAVRSDILDNSALFMPEAGNEDGEHVPAMVRKAGDDVRFRRYHVNVFVDHGGTTGAPLVIEDHPTQPGLVGRIEYRQHLGTLTTDFHLLRPGALHRANGGFLVVEAHKLLANPFAWEDLKRALRNREIRIEAPGSSWGVMSTQSMEPAAIPLDLKVVLLGKPDLYYLLSESDPEFRELFKVAADFDTTFPREERTIHAMSLLLADIAQKKSLPPLEAPAAARIIQHGSRLAENAKKMTACIGALTDLMREAAWIAKAHDKDIIQADHVVAAIEAQRRRCDRIPIATRDDIADDVVSIYTDGWEVGQINGLVVISIGGNEFGRPTRITARTRPGRGECDDIEREVDLSGPSHSKGILVLSSFLKSRFGYDGLVCFAASLTFEQSYGPIDGDSASSSELYALLSSLAETPLDQSIAVTGSVDQFGAVQAIGGANEKIEGFFDICVMRGLNGRQGVIIPAANIQHLMLREDVVNACRAGQFRIWPIYHVDQGIEILTGLPAGSYDADTGRWSAGSINRRVAARLKMFAQVINRDADSDSSETSSGRR